MCSTSVHSKVNLIVNHTTKSTKEYVFKCDCISLGLIGKYFHKKLMATVERYNVDIHSFTLMII